VAVAKEQAWDEVVVRDGALVGRGMPRFAELSDAQLESLRHFVRARARESLGEANAR